MENFEYKEEIINTRKGCLGSSDGKMLSQISTMGYVPKSAYKRMAIVKGLIEPKEGIITNAMRFGDIIENKIYTELVSGSDKEYESNPLWVSKIHSGRNFKLISHPDVTLKDDKDKTLYVYEIKTTKESWKSARDTYKGQLYIHYMLSKELAPKGYKTKLILVTYDTNGLDLDKDLDCIEFEPNRITIGAVKFVAPPFDMKKARDIIDDFLENFSDYYGDDEVDANLLPINVKNEFDKIATILNEIKVRENEVERFKQKLYEFMAEKEIKSIKSDSFSITRIDPTESKGIDYKAFFDYYENVYPRKARRYAEQYAKMTKKKGYVKINLKKQ